MKNHETAVFAHSMDGLRDAMRIAMQVDAPPMGLATDVFASACILAAVMHPEWAVAVTRSSDAQVRSLAEQLVRRSPIVIEALPTDR